MAEELQDPHQDRPAVQHIEQARDLTRSIQLAGEYRTMMQTKAWVDLDKFLQTEFQIHSSTCFKSRDIDEIRRAQERVLAINAIWDHIKAVFNAAESASAYQAGGPVDVA
jgi:hypothetical protein